MLRKTALMFIVFTIILSCARLDSNLFRPSKVDSYKLEDYKGETEITVDDELYDIPNVLIHHLDGEFESDDGKSKVPIQAYFIGDRDRIGDADYKVILYCHGTRDHMDFYWPRTKLLANIGSKNLYGVLTLDYRGYGATPGEPSENGMYADVDAAIKWLADEGLTSENFIIYGYSLGSAPATELTANPRSQLVASKLILEAPFASAEVIVQDSTLLAMPGSFVTNLKIDNAEAIKKLDDVQLLWLHGEKDDFLSIDSHGELVYKNHPGVEGVDKFAVRVSDGGHTDLPLKVDDLPLHDYLIRLYDFIETQ